MNKHEEARNNAFNILPKSIGSKSSQLKLKYYFEVDRYIKQSEATEKELDLYRKLIGLMVCVPQNETYHYVVRYTDDVKFNFILNQINNLSKVGEDK